ncbi:SC6A4-like protein [Mya arenaria]|uniref:SC6A4-like protein n=1 Tax=Mya arenaria TaxID=6604 RepID=A0ABY7E3Z1_MYAAR|nr:SC6A4-like protein [Mya arenaria]
MDTDTDINVFECPTVTDALLNIHEKDEHSFKREMDINDHNGITNTQDGHHSQPPPYENTTVSSEQLELGVHENGDNGDNGTRETWGNKIDFLLSVTGFAVDLGAFLIPYFLMLVFLGLPLFYMELALGQFHRSGAIKIWDRLCPMFKGTGVAIIMVATYVGMYYNTIIAWALYYLVNSFRSEVPWASCGNEWNTPNCISISQGYNASMVTNFSNPSALEYFQFKALESQRSTGIGDLGNVKWDLCLCLLGVMTVVYLALWKGIKSSGKAVWITATAPYVILLILLVRGATLPGARQGIIYYVTPVWSRLLELGVWLDAAAQIFFSLGPGFGTLLALSSYNKFNNNCYMDALLTASINCLTSLLAGFVVFSVLGYMSHVLAVPIENLAVQGPGLVFFVYPEAISTLEGSTFWAIIFFLLLITLGIDSTFGGLESVITALCDISPRLASKRKFVVLGVVVVCFLGALPTTTYGGQYLITLLDTHAAPVALIGICLVEAVAVSWFYGVQHFSNDIERMLGFQPGIYWKICWAIICPTFLAVLFVLSIVAYAGLEIEDYRFPHWAESVGWLVTSSSLVCIPVGIIASLVFTRGTFKQRILEMTRGQSTDYPPNDRGFTLRNAWRLASIAARYVYSKVQSLRSGVFRTSSQTKPPELKNAELKMNGGPSYPMTEIVAGINGHGRKAELGNHVSPEHRASDSNTGIYLHENEHLPSTQTNSYGFNSGNNLLNNKTNNDTEGRIIINGSGHRHSIETDSSNG